MKKRIISFLLAVCMIVVLLPSNVLAADEVGAENSEDPAISEAAPEKAETPEDPEEPEEPQEPEEPENPENPETPEEPENPETPEEPENPENPEIPEEPENPDNPEIPEEPETPETPEEPETPETPEGPQEPENPENPETPEEPENPETPEEPEEPVEPEVPEEPEEPEVPEEPEEPEEIIEISGKGELVYAAPSPGSASPTPLTLDGETAGSISVRGGYAYFSFTPAETGMYTFTSLSGYDTYGYLYEGTSTEIAHNDDGGDDCNFKITELLAAGQTYILAVRFYSSDETGAFTISLTGSFAAYAAATNSAHASLYVPYNSPCTLTVGVFRASAEELIISWSCDGYVIDGASALSYTTDAVTQAHVYQCAVSNGEETQRVTFRVGVENGLHVYAAGTQQDILNIETAPGELVTLGVDISVGDDTDMSITWYDESFNVIDGAKESEYYIGAITYPTGYYCVVRDLYGNEATVEFTVRVENNFHVYAAGTHSNEAEIGALPGEPLTIAVDISATDTTNLSITWYKEGYDPDLDDYTRIEFEGEHDRELNLDIIEEPGWYYCDVEDPYGNEACISFYVYVENNFRVYAAGTTTRWAEVGALPGEPLTIAVDISATDTTDLSITWSKEEYDSEEDDYIRVEFEGKHGSELDLGIIEERGTYYCDVIDRYGNEAYIEFYVYIENNFRVWVAGTTSRVAEIGAQPGVPVTLALDISATDMTDLSITWSKEEYDPEEGDYISVEIEGEHGRELDLGVINEPGTYYCHVRDLYDNNAYIEFHVYLENGFSAWIPGSSNPTFQTVAVPYGESAELAYSYSGNDLENVVCEWYTGYVYEYGDFEQDWDIDPFTTSESPFVTGPITANVGYQCRISDGYGKTVSLTYRVIVDNEFTAVAESSGTDYAELFGAVGVQLTLKVLASAREGDINYNWSKNWCPPGSSDWQYWDLPDEGPEILTDPLECKCYYYCRVSDKFGTAITVEFEVSVTSDSSFSVSAVGGTPFNGGALFTVKPGDDLTLAMDVQGTGPFTYEWSYITGIWGWWNAVEGATGTTYQLRNIQQSAEIAGSVYDQYGNEKWVRFYVAVDNGFSVTDPVQVGPWDDYYRAQTVTVPAGDSVTLSVAARARLGTLNYEWYNYDSSTPLQSGPSSQFTIDPVTESSEIYCRVTDTYNTAITIGFAVILENQFTAEAEEETVFVSPGETATLRVIASAATGDITYRWYRVEDDPIVGGNRWILLSNETGTLTVGPVYASQTYCCEVYDCYGTEADVWFDVRIDIDNEFTAEAEEETFYLAPGETATLQVIASAATGDFTYRWYRVEYDSSNDENHWIRLPDVTGSTLTVGPVYASQTYCCEVYDCYGTEEDVWFYVNIDNGFTAYVAGTQQNWFSKFVKLNSKVKMSVKAKANTGSFTYQWIMYEYDEYGNWLNSTVLPDANGPKLTSDPVKKHVQYTCLVTDCYGTTRYVYFNLYVSNGFNAYAAGTKSTYVNTTVLLNDSAELAVTATAKKGSINYTWYKDSAPGAWDPELIPGEKTAKLTTGPITETTQYYCMVCDMYGTTRYVQFIVDPSVAAPTITEQPESQFAPKGNAYFFVEADGGGMSYQWYVLKKGGQTWTKIKNETNSVLVIKATAKLDGYQYRCEVQNLLGTATSEAATLTFVAAPKITGQPKAVKAAEGETAVFSVKTKGLLLEYQWYVKAPNGQWEALEGKTDATLEIVATRDLNSCKFRCVVTNIAGSKTSKAVALTVK